MKPALTPQQALFAASDRGAFGLYRELVSGAASLPAFFYHEFCITLFSCLPGMAGLALRALFYPHLFCACGKRPAFGRGVTIRRPKQISIGDKVLCDDYSVLDVRGQSGSVSIGSYVSIGRFSTVAAKEGKINIGEGVNIGSYCRVATQSSVEIDKSVLIGAFSYIGPGNHTPGGSDEPLITKGMDIRGGVKIGAHAWIGAHVTVLDGCSIGEGSVIGAHSLVRDNVPAGMLAAGTPARVIRELK